jgi:hypothetical protein
MQQLVITHSFGLVDTEALIGSVAADMPHLSGGWAIPLPPSDMGGRL